MWLKTSGHGPSVSKWIHGKNELSSTAAGSSAPCWTFLRNSTVGLSVCVCWLVHVLVSWLQLMQSLEMFKLCIGDVYSIHPSFVFPPATLSSHGKPLTLIEFMVADNDILSQNSRWLVLILFPSRGTVGAFTTWLRFATMDQYPWRHMQDAVQKWRWSYFRRLHDDENEMALQWDPCSYVLQLRECWSLRYAWLLDDRWVDQWDVRRSVSSRKETSNNGKVLLVSERRLRATIEWRIINARGKW